MAFLLHSTPEEHPNRIRIEPCIQAYVRFETLTQLDPLFRKTSRENPLSGGWVEGQKHRGTKEPGAFVSPVGWDKGARCVCLAFTLRERGDSLKSRVPKQGAPLGAQRSSRCKRTKKAAGASPRPSVHVLPKSAIRLLRRCPPPGHLRRLQPLRPQSSPHRQSSLPYPARRCHQPGSSDRLPCIAR